MRGIAQKTKDLIAVAYEALEEIQPVGLRALHYNIFSRSVIEYDNDKSSYRRLSSVTTYARRVYREWELLVKSLDTPAMRGLSTTTGEKELTIVVRWLKAHNPKAYQMLRDDLLGEDDWQELIAGFPTVNCAPEFSIPPDWMCDETRELEKVNLWDDAGKYADAVERSYRRNNWTTQPYHCEIWCEKATVLGSIRPITEKWGVGLRVTHGFASTGMEQNIGDLFEDIDKPIMIFFLGDHDPSGHDLERDIHERAQKATGKKFEMRRLAIFPEDIKRFHLPPQRIKNTDVRSTEFRKKYGANAATVELDALPPDELRQRIEASIMGLIDFDDWDRQVNVQTEELKSIKEFANTMKNLPPPPEEARP